MSRKKFDVEIYLGPKALKDKGLTRREICEGMGRVGLEGNLLVDGNVDCRYHHIISGISEEETREISSGLGEMRTVGLMVRPIEQPARRYGVLEAIYRMASGMFHK